LIIFQNNYWKKRGICLQPLLYPYKCALPGVNITYYCSISVYSQDGSVALSHSGHEMGQVGNFFCGSLVLVS
jgi:xanthine dehydrogenase molybdopterin-binding subunit B